MNNTSKCIQCFECEGIRTAINPNDKGNYCEKCIAKYNLYQCDGCGKYKSRELFVKEKSLCNDCNWEFIKMCEECNIIKPCVLFLNDDKYCGECQFLMDAKCIECKQKVKYYKLDNGKYCEDCQKKILLECSHCKNKLEYSNFYYDRNRLWCKKCVAKDICIPMNQLLTKYEPK
jgi:hypothetical protein